MITVFWSLRASTAARIFCTISAALITAIHYDETLMLAGLRPSVGTVGDALDNALCETTIGLYKTECIRDGSPFRTGPIRTRTDLEDITFAWVSWFGYAAAHAPPR
jgi:transposase InsO family protein